MRRSVGRAWLAKIGMSSFVACSMLYFLGPIVLMIISSFGGGRYLEFPPPTFSLVWYQAFMRDPVWLQALGSSILIAAVVALLSVPLAGGAAYWIERSRSRWRGPAFQVLIAPALIPVIIYAVAFFSLFADWPLLGDWGRLIIAYTVLAQPYAFLVLRAGVMQCDQVCEDAARTLGATSGVVLWRIVLPALRWPIVSSALLSFIVAFTEPALAIFLTSGQTATLPQKTWEGLRYGLDQRSIIGTTIFIYALLLLIVVGSTTYLLRTRTQPKGY